MARSETLLDTGPLVSLLWPRDAHHEGCVEIYEQLEGDLLTTEAVVTEAMHLLARFPNGPDICLEFVLNNGVVPVGLTAPMWPGVRASMRMYRDLPMDFADATLLALAEELGIHRVFTLDRRDFGLYRTRRSRHLEVLAPPLLD